MARFHPFLLPNNILLPVGTPLACPSICGWMFTPLPYLGYHHDASENIGACIIFSNSCFCFLWILRSRVTGSYNTAALFWMFWGISIPFSIVYFMLWSHKCYFLTSVTCSFIQSCPSLFRVQNLQHQTISENKWIFTSKVSAKDVHLEIWLIGWQPSLKYARMTYNFVLKNTGKTVTQLPAPWKLAFIADLNPQI